MAAMEGCCSSHTPASHQRLVPCLFSLPKLPATGMFNHWDMSFLGKSRLSWLRVRECYIDLPSKKIIRDTLFMMEVLGLVHLSQTASSQSCWVCVFKVWEHVESDVAISCISSSRSKSVYWAESKEWSIYRIRRMSEWIDRIECFT